MCQKDLSVQQPITIISFVDYGKPVKLAAVWADFRACWKNILTVCVAATGVDCLRVDTKHPPTRNSYIRLCRQVYNLMCTRPGDIKISSTVTSVKARLPVKENVSFQLVLNLCTIFHICAWFLGLFICFSLVDCWLRNLNSRLKLSETVLQQTNVFFATVNQMFSGSFQLPTTAERAVIKSWSTVHTT